MSACDRLLYFSHPSIVIEVSKIFLVFGSYERIKNCTKALMRFINISSESKIIILYMIECISFKYPELLSKNYKELFII